MDVQPKCVAVGPGGYAVVICIGEVSKFRKTNYSAFFYSIILILLLCVFSTLGAVDISLYCVNTKKLNSVTKPMLLNAVKIQQ